MKFDIETRIAHLKTNNKYPYGYAIDYLRSNTNWELTKEQAKSILFWSKEAIDIVKLADLRLKDIAIKQYYYNLQNKLKKLL